ncbi:MULTISPECIES: aldo/keto reductase [Erwinia]|uniref:Oxidoreductase n=1 Tax=Erwinia rhapontici TaxID=55212 RepID=A0ABN6DPP7_ERWRD|nr:MULTISPECIES: aldo/keto reductase [Erwinia]MBP2152777.1 aryl-alcohol dehydrogenase-like predicted oxidoreductase [Erwinia rhapontici]MCS3608118.1 aryl-alcohol dehydrogenase-like predicted oxidoreductase [Erwinia rhapontici]NKG28855.1 aldo/keto reductase [Erwinia rhapontici]NNS08045.1 aldo/keto reductase [Erwinia sp. JH02]TDT00583.1 aryl-alcohol dehydrogenase-like predicted oxidoreductase [Erwinia rhapontici]
MHTRNLSQNLSVSSVGYGAMGLSEFYGQTDDQASLKLLHKLVDLDITFIDTANLYGRGHNERLIGHFLAGLDKTTREQFKIATKCGIDRSPDESYARTINNQPDYITRCCNESLKRLGVERIDLFYLHRVSQATPIEESMECLSRLVKEGKINHIGLCEVSAATLHRAHAVHPLAALQTEYSLWTRDIEQEILPAVKALGIGLVPYSPLGRGFLTGKYRNNSDFAEGDFRKNNERFIQSSLDHNAQLLDVMGPLAKKYGCTTGQIALAWLLAQYDKLVPIPGTKHISYLTENAQAANIVLEATDITLLNNIHQRVEIKGGRYSEEGMKGVNA